MIWPIVLTSILGLAASGSPQDEPAAPQDEPLAPQDEPLAPQDRSHVHPESAVPA